jgi:hypothetical protein
MNRDWQEIADGIALDFNPQNGRVWVPGRGFVKTTEDDLYNQVQDVQAQVTNVVTTVATASTSLVPLQVVSCTATESPIKRQDRTFSEVSVSFVTNPADTNYAEVRVWFTGYLGSSNPTLMAEGSASPLTFICETTGETVTVTVQAVSSDGTPADFDLCPTTTVVLDGVVSAPPAPSISGSLTAIPLGLQFSFNQVSLGGTQDVIDSYRVYHNSTNNSGTATLFQTFKHDPTAAGSIVVQESFGSGGIAQYYWVSAVNTVGLESTKTAAQSTTVYSGLASLDSDVADGQIYFKSDARYGQHGVYLETFDHDPSLFYTLAAGDFTLTTYPSNGVAGGKVLNSGKQIWAVYPQNIPFDASKLYRMRTRVRKLPTYHITTSGGSGTLKYYIDKGISTNGLSYTLSVQVVNTGTKSVVVADNIHSQTVTVAAGTAQNVSINTTGDGVGALQIRFQALAAGDSLDFYVGTPSIVRNDTSAQILSGGELTYTSTWQIWSGATVGVTDNSSSTSTCYVGLEGVGADGTTLVNYTGSNTTSSQHYFCASGVNTPVSTSWSVYTGFIKGNGASAAYLSAGASTGAGNPADPSQMHPNVRYVRPLFILNYTGQHDIWEIDEIALDLMPDSLDSIPDGSDFTRTPRGAFPSVGAGPLGAAPNATTTDSKVNYQVGGRYTWDGVSAIPAGVNLTYFYARWEGYIVPPTSGTYTIGVNSDDGCNLYIAGVPLVVNLTNDWQGANWTTLTYTQSETVPLQAGVRYPIVLEWQNATGPGGVQLLWTPPGGSVALIPSSVLTTSTSTMTNNLSGRWWNGTSSLWYPTGNHYIDFSQSHPNKTLDFVGDGSSYARTLASFVTDGVPYTNMGAWNSGTSYAVGSQVSYSGNFWLCIVANSNSAPTTTNTNWLLIGPQSLDNLQDGTTRFGGIQISTGDGFQLLTNPDFAGGSTTGYYVYDNNSTGNVTIATESDNTAPNSSGYRLKIVTSAGGTTPGWGGWSRQINVDSGTWTTPNTYHRGSTILWRIRAYIPVGYTLNWASNATGTGATFTWLTSQAGTGGWFDYCAKQVIGSSGSFSSTGFFYLTGSTTPVTWYVAVCSAVCTTHPSYYNRDLDYVQDGGTYRRPLYVSASGTFAISTGFNDQGSIAPNQPIIISYTTTTTSISLSWTSQSVLRADGTTLTLNSGSQNYTGLSSSTTYYIYPYINVSNGNIGFTNPNPPATSPSSTYSVQASYDGRVPVNVIKITTPASGGGGGTGGGGDICPEANELVDVEGKGLIKAEEVKVGDMIKGKCFIHGTDEYRTVIATSGANCRAWRMYKGHRVSPTEPVWDGKAWTPAFKIPGATFDDFAGRKVNITVESNDYNEANYYLMGGEEPVLIHNLPMNPC